MKFADHPFWLVAFRPFFVLVCLSGIVMPLLWVLVFSGQIHFPNVRLTPFQWHAHEMFFGFGWAMVGGFLLTAGKNWVKIRGYYGGWVIFLVAAWIFERIGMWYGGDWPDWLFVLSSQLYIVSAALMVLAMLLPHRANDSYRRDNLYIFALLLLFPVAKCLLLDGERTAIGELMTLGLFRLIFLIMLERTLTDFIKNVFKRDILRNVWLDDAIKILALLLAFAGFLPAAWQGGLAIALATLLVLRFPFWEPKLGFSRIDVAIMYLGYLAIVLQLVSFAADALAPPVWIGSLTVHLFTFGVMGLIIPGMIVRIGKGHTGRKVQFEPLDKAVLWIMIAAFVVRIVVPQFLPAAYLRWVDLAASGWIVTFAILLWRYTPFLLQPRVDGKVH